MQSRLSVVVAAVCGTVAVALTPGSVAGSERAVTVDRSAHVAAVRFGPGRAKVSFLMREPAGVVLLYRLATDVGVRVRASAQLAPLTVPLWIATAPAGPGSACTARARRLTCTVGEEWCPMPPGTWRFRVTKLAGAAGDVEIWFRIGPPPS